MGLYDNPTPSPVNPRIALGNVPAGYTPATTAPWTLPTTAATPTDPGATGTDIYGLSPEQEAWSTFSGTVSTTASGRVPPSMGHREYTQDGAPTPAQTKLEGETALQLMQKFTALGNSPKLADRQEWANTQRELIAINAYGNGATDQTVNLGQWTGQADSAALLKALIGYRMAAGKEGAGMPVTFAEWLDNHAKQQYANQQAGVAGSSSGGGGGGSLPSTPQLADPAKLELTVQKAAQAALGHNLSPDELNKFVGQFHQEQMTSYTDSLHGQGTTVDANDPRAQAIQFVTGNNKQEFGQHQAQGYTDSFLNMFLPSASAAPNVNIDPTAVSY